MSNESSISINQNDDKILKEFSSKFISTISALSDDYKSGGSKKGWLLSDAVKQFDKDWHHNYSYYMEKLECENPLQLAEKLGSRVRVFLDGYNGWRVAPMKTLKNINVLNQIDSDIEKRNRPHRCPVNIQPKNGPKNFQTSKNKNFDNNKCSSNNNENVGCNYANNGNNNNISSHSSSYPRKEETSEIRRRSNMH